jgi:hypothetical protein
MPIIFVIIFSRKLSQILVGVAILILSTGVLATVASYCGRGGDAATSDAQKTDTQNEEQGFKVNFGGSSKNFNANFNPAVNNVGMANNVGAMNMMNTSPSRFAQQRSRQQVPSAGDVQAQLSQFSDMLTHMQQYIQNLQSVMGGQNLNSTSNPNALSPGHIAGRSLRGTFNQLSPNPGSKQSSIGNSPCPRTYRRFGSTVSGDAQSTMSNDLSLANNNANSMNANVNVTFPEDNAGNNGRDSPEKENTTAAESPDASTHCSSPDI